MPELDFVLARCFQLAGQSVTLTVDKKFDTSEDSALVLDHSEDVKALGLPFGWNLISMQEDEWTTLLRFEKK